MGSTSPYRQSMNDLPNEIANKIISHVEDTETLYNLTLTSHRFYRISLPFLYRKISHRMYEQPSRLHSAIRTLLRKPELANKVESISLRDPHQNDSFWDLKSWTIWAKSKYNAALHDEDHPLFISGAQHLIDGTPSRDDMIKREEAHAALLISLCPNVTHLHLENPSTRQEPPRFVLDHLVLDIIHPQIRKGAVLQNLQSLTAVTARLEGGQGGFRLASIATFFHLPNLRKVTAVACFEPEDELFVGFDYPSSSSSVREIRVIRSSVCPLGLSQMIKSCKTVETFDCDWAGVSVGWVEINFPLLTGALAEHKDTLTRLRLDTAKHYDSWPEHDDGLVPPLGSALRQFDKLKVLDVPASALIGWDEDDVGGFELLRDVLPPNIEELKVNEYAPRILDMMLDFVGVCAEMFPKLRKLTISRVHAGSADVEDNLQEKFEMMAPDVDLSFEDAREVDHFESSVGSGSV